MEIPSVLERTGTSAISDRTIVLSQRNDISNIVSVPCVFRRQSGRKNIAEKAYFEIVASIRPRRVCVFLSIAQQTPNNCNVSRKHTTNVL